MCLLFCQCRKADTYSNLKNLQLGKEFNMGQGDKAILKGANGQAALSLEVQEIIDGRCPANSNCIWAGYASVKLFASDKKGENKQLLLCTGDCQSASIEATAQTAIEFADVTYQFTLLEVNPFPGTGQDNAPKQVKLVVEKL
ncbi:hypothetical protein C1N53_11745 [Pontibacter sp. SGAir0037]|nr:hypothetical protein C1N53_11745 [Pontibacter sp. SGAir0037]